MYFNYIQKLCFVFKRKNNFFLKLKIVIKNKMVEKPLELNDQELESLSKHDLVIRCKQMQSCVNNLEKLNRDYLNKLNKKSFEVAKLKNMIMNTIPAVSKEVSIDSQPPQQQQQQQLTINQSNDHQQPKQQKLTLIDPCINSIIIQLKKELEDVRKKKDDLQNELNSTKFNPESQLTKRLMFKCNKLLEENEKLGKMISSGNVALLENDLAYHKQLLNEANENEQSNFFLI
jgi:hypothetical protein